MGVFNGDSMYNSGNGGEPPVELISEIFAEFLAPVCRRDVGRRVEVAVRFVVL